MATAQQTRKAGKTQLLREILAGADGQIRPVTVTTGYRLATVFVACALLLIPVLYASIILGFGYGLFWHATANFSSLTKAGFLGILAYIIPLVIGPFILFFLLKPFLAGREKPDAPKRIKREAEPFLYDYVEAIARAVHAPPPTSIRVECHVNASASFRRGLWSMFTSDMTLTLGLPLVSGLNVRQLSGVIAHEFGHFAQRGGMRASYFVRTMLHWFERIVYERDKWDVWLYLHSVYGAPVFRPFFYTLRFFVWLARWVPWTLRLLGVLIATNLDRQMEFDADRHEVRFAGLNAFQSTFQHLHELQLSTHWAFESLGVFADEGRLADDLPALIVANLKHMTPKIRAELKEAVRKQETRLLDTHPSDRERVASARAERTDGILKLPRSDDELPASILFRDFKRLCKIVTREIYVDGLGLRISKGDLHPVSELMERLDARIESSKTLHRYFQVSIPPLWPLPIDKSVLEPPSNPKELRDAMKESRRRMLAQLPSYKQAAKHYEVAEEKLISAAEALALFDVGLNPRGSDFGIRGNSYDDAYDQHDRAEAAVSRLAGTMLGFEMAAAERLSAALRLLQVDQVAERIENGEELRFELKRLVPDALFVSRLMTDLRSFYISYRRVNVLWAHLRSSDNNRDLVEAIFDVVDRYYERLEDVEDRLQQQIYPFDHAKADTTMREYALPNLPEPNDLGGRMAATEHLFSQLVSVQMRLFGKLAEAAEKVEDAFQLPRLPQPKGDEEQDEEKDRRNNQRRRR